ncbi:MAG: DegT/DnrJ/EryC1/StrS family aminotransferase [Vampirovibrio sp.]|nr:DegT/DnrJ/EryC1/StrS family aminotransferase [Vampirovibrio sp.]
MIPILDLTRQYNKLKQEFETALIEVASSGYYILGPNVQAFEKEVADYIGSDFAIGCANGSDALFLALRALDIGPGDEVITTPFTYIATSESIVRAGATPVFVDIEPDTMNMDLTQLEQVLTPRTKAIMPVHIFGQPISMTPLLSFAKTHQLYLVEDCAQAIGATENGKQVGTFGDIGCFSFFPSKNLGAMGDGGLLTTNDPKLNDRLRMLRVHGSKQRYYHEEAGINSRLDEIQAAILRIKLKRLDTWNNSRRQVAENYNKLLSPLVSQVQYPPSINNTSPVFHQYTIRLTQLDSGGRNAVQQQMTDAGVQTMIYYPVPLYRQQTHHILNLSPSSFPICETASEQVLSLPMFPEITFEEQETVVNILQSVLSKVPMKTLSSAKS